MESCLYEGNVCHERVEPMNHRFQYRLYMVYLDLAEVPALMRAGVLSEGRFASRAFLRRDHFGDPRQPLAQNVRDLVLMETGIKAVGPIRLLTQLRHFGCYFSPLNLLFCYAGDGNTLDAVVAEVQNTPWLERHCYLLWDGNKVSAGAEAIYRHRKAFHVSPFMGMDMDYHWRLSLPGNELRVGIENSFHDNVVFRAALHLKRSPLSRRTLMAMQCRYPLITARLTAAIYYQAFKLWRKKCPFHPHPNRRCDSGNPHRRIELAAQESSAVFAGKT